jgi:mercuric reductase
MQTCDLIVIGASQGGQALALHAAQAGQRVILFERDLRDKLACPAQMLDPLLEITRLLRQLPALTQAGITTQWDLNLPSLLNFIREHMPLPQPMVEHSNLTVIGKEASFAGKNLVTDGKEQYRADRIVISSGRTPALPEHIQGISETPYLTAATLLQMEKLPARIAVLGAGRTGVTLAQALAAMGCQVHLLDRADRILPGMSPDVSEAVTQALTSDGVQLQLGASVIKISYRADRFTLRCTNEAEVISDALLLAIGSKARTQKLDTRLGTIKLDAQGQIEINPRLETSVPGVYAIGSCTDQPLGQASSWEDAQRLMDLWSNGTRYLGDRPRSYIVNTQPQAGSVGLTQDEAELAGYRVSRKSLPVLSSTHTSDGFVELMIDTPSGRILGASIVAPEAAQAIATLSLFIAMNRTWRDLLATPLTEGTLMHHLQTLARQFDGVE